MTEGETDGGSDAAVTMEYLELNVNAGEINQRLCQYLGLTPLWYWNPASWWKGGVGQYYHRPHAATWGLRARQLGEAGAIGGVSYGAYETFFDD